MVKLFNFFNPEKGSARPSLLLGNMKRERHNLVNAGKFREFGNNGVVALG
jgi:hypothetical protein